MFRTRFHIVAAGALVLGLATDAVGSPPALDPQEPVRFIEFGWDMPSASFVAETMGEMARRPFDGVVIKPLDGPFHRGASNVPIAFDGRSWGPDEVALADMARIADGPLTHVFLGLQASTLDPDETDPAGWLDDERWVIVEANLRLLSRAMAAAQARGVFFDEEPYVADPWTYDQRTYPGASIEEVRSAVRRRGATFMGALQSSVGAFDLVLMFGLCATKVGGGNRSLVPAFYAGLLDAIEEGTRLVDGNENGYYQHTPEDRAPFLAAQAEAASLLPVDQRDIYLAHLARGIGVYTDLLVNPEGFESPFFRRRLPIFVPPDMREAFTEDHLRGHAAAVDAYVWVWTEQYDWWRPRGARDTRAQLDPPRWFERALRRAREGASGETSPRGLDGALNGVRIAQAVRRRTAFEESGIDLPAARVPFPLGRAFPLGLYAVPGGEEMADARSRGWNLVHRYPDFGADYLDQAAASGVLTFANLPGEDKIPPRDELRALIEDWAARPAVGWWDFPEERRYWRDGEMQLIRDCALQIREEDPLRRPGMMYIPGHYDADGISRYVPFIDVVPASAYGTYAQQPAPWVRWRVEETRRGVAMAGAEEGPDYLGGQKIVVAIVELFPHDQVAEMSPARTRHDIWAAIAGGANGVLVYAWHYRDQHPNLTAASGALDAAAAALTARDGFADALLFGQRVDLGGLTVTEGPATCAPFTPHGKDRDPVELPALALRAHVRGDRIHGLLVNSSQGKVGATLGPLPEGYRTVGALEGSRAPTLEGGDLRFEVPALGVVRWTLSR